MFQLVYYTSTMSNEMENQINEAVEAVREAII